MARALAGTPPQVVAPSPAGPQQTLAWLQMHYETFRGQWVAVRLRDPARIAHAPTLTQLWQVASSAVLQDCLIHYMHPVAPMPSDGVVPNSVRLNFCMAAELSDAIVRYERLSGNYAALSQQSQAAFLR